MGNSRNIYFFCFMTIIRKDTKKMKKQTNNGINYAYNTFRILVFSYIDGKFNKLTCSWMPYTDPKSKNLKKLKTME